jgi:hypothetical protein
LDAAFGGVDQVAILSAVFVSLEGRGFLVGEDPPSLATQVSPG